MIDLSPGTLERVQALFPKEQWPAVEELLLNHPVLKNMEPPKWSELAERIRFAVLKLAGGNLVALERRLDAAKVDWRDTLMAAGFGHETTAHKQWKP